MRLPHPTIVRTSFIVALLLFQTGSPVMAQDRAETPLHGVVLDAESGDPVEFVHVFIDGTSIGDVTDADGSFSLRLPPFRPFRLVISMVGYDMYAEEIQDENQASNARTIRLTARTTELGQFTVEAERPRAWRRRLDLLEMLIFSTTDAGRRCSIENPEILDLVNEGDELRATAASPLHILNPILGYRVTIHDFNLRGTRQEYRWTGRIQFEELPAASDEDAERIRQNRVDAYVGSMRHFLRSLTLGRLQNDGFEASLVQAPGRTRGAEPVLESGRSRQTGAPQILFGSEHASSRSLMFQGTLRVTYRHERESPVYLAWMESITPGTRVNEGRDPYQTSWVDLPYGLAIVDTLGNTVSDGSLFPVHHFGYWSWERVGDMLPADWIPPPDR